MSKVSYRRRFSVTVVHNYAAANPASGSLRHRSIDRHAQGALPRAVGAHNRKELSLLHAQVHVIQRPIAIGVGVAEVVNKDRHEVGELRGNKLGIKWRETL